jgi:hypothetical protein
MQKMRPPIQVNDEGERYYDQEDAEDHFAYLEDQLSALRASLPSSQPVEGKKAGKYKAAPPEFTEHSEHDQLTQAELVSAAGAYLWVARCNVQYKALAQDFRRPPHGWPKQAGLPWEAWDDPIQNLNSAAALIQAEIDRLNRKAGK